jgi:hypothetical protein
MYMYGMTCCVKKPNKECIIVIQALLSSFRHNISFDIFKNLSRIYRNQSAAFRIFSCQNFRFYFKWKQCITRYTTFRKCAASVVADVDLQADKTNKELFCTRHILIVRVQCICWLNNMDHKIWRKCVWVLTLSSHFICYSTLYKFILNEFFLNYEAVTSYKEQNVIDEGRKSKLHT